MKFGLDKKALFLSIILMFSASVVGQNDLPELGDSSSKYLSASQEKEIGLALFQKMLNSREYVDDLLLMDYIQSLGNKIARNADLGDTELTFSLLNKNHINAFVLPGGYMTFHTGLITSTRNESELAAVISHEIAHVTQHHIPRLLARIDENQVFAMAAIFASLVAGGQVGLAGITATSAALTSNQLRYTRGFEQEADALGIDLLAKSGFDPDAMSEFFTQLEKHNQHSTQLPEFLLTHPMSLRRKVEADNRSSQHQKSNTDYPSSLEYYFARTRIIALQKRYHQDTIAYFHDQLTLTKELPESAANYGLVITYIKRKEFEKATQLLNILLQEYPDHPWLLQAQGEIILGQKKYQQAVNHYLHLTKKFSDHLYFSLFLADTYLANKQPKEAKKLLRRQIRRYPKSYLLHQKLSKVYLALTEIVLALQADIEYYAILGNYTMSIARAELALNSVDDKDSYLAVSIAARKTQLEQRKKIQKRALRL